jgi:ureidoglycolate lyase
LRPAAATVLAARPLSAHAFASFGDVIARPASGGRSINGGTSMRYDDVARLDLAADGGAAQLSLFVSTPRGLPLECEALERHPLSTQAFIPVGHSPMLVIVATAADAPHAAETAAFVTDGRQGVNFHRGVWHHPLVALAGDATFVVVGRGGSANFELRPFAGGARVRVEA